MTIDEMSDQVDQLEHDMWVLTPTEVWRKVILPHHLLPVLLTLNLLETPIVICHKMNSMLLPSPSTKRKSNTDSSQRF